MLNQIPIHKKLSFKLISLILFVKSHNLVNFRMGCFNDLTDLQLHCFRFSCIAKQILATGLGTCFVEFSQTGGQQYSDNPVPLPLPKLPQKESW